MDAVVSFDDLPGQCWVGDEAWQRADRAVLNAWVCKHLGLNRQEWDPLKAVDAMKKKGEHGAFYHLARVQNQDYLYGRPAQRAGQDTMGRGLE